MYYGPRKGIHGPCIHALLTLTRGHSTTVRDATGNPCERSIWSLCSLYSLDALTLTPSSRNMGTACDKLENMCTVPSIATHQCARPGPRLLLIYTLASTYCPAPPVERTSVVMATLGSNAVCVGPARDDEQTRSSSSSSSIQSSPGATHATQQKCSVNSDRNRSTCRASSVPVSLFV